MPKARRRPCAKRVRRSDAQRPRRSLIGDGANDVKMMQLAGISVAYRAKPVVREQATYALNHSALDGVLNWFTNGG